MNVYAVKKRSVLFCSAWLITHPLDTIIFTEFNLLSIVDARQISVACNKSSKGNCVNAPNVERNKFSPTLTTLALTVWIFNSLDIIYTIYCTFNANGLYTDSVAVRTN